jgi:glycosyltransferase involved in cell wall biosynthesis
MKKNIPLSIAIITKNEAENLSDCLRSVQFADQIVVVDSGSTDDTVKVASDFGCEVVVEKGTVFPEKIIFRGAGLSTLDGGRTGL